jgi:hypothetical protein
MIERNSCFRISSNQIFLIFILIGWQTGAEKIALQPYLVPEIWSRSLFTFEFQCGFVFFHIPTSNG